MSYTFLPPLCQLQGLLQTIFDREYRSGEWDGSMLVENQNKKSEGMVLKYKNKVQLKRCPFTFKKQTLFLRPLKLKTSYNKCDHIILAIAQMKVFNAKRKQ